MLVREALAQAPQLGVARLDAQWLLEHLLQRPRSWLLAHDDSTLPAPAAQAWPALLQRRAGGEPLAYVVGEREFCGLKLKVSPAVLVPRPETEGLVQWALECLSCAPATSVVDLGTGSGAMALALKHARPLVQVTATDTSAAALDVARSNGQRLGLDVAWGEGDWWLAVGEARFGLAVCNPPYIALGDAHLAALSHEPMLALSPGGDGLDALRRVIAGAAAHLLPRAWLLLEHGHDQAQAVQALFARHGFEEVQTRADLAGLPRFTGAAWPAVKQYRPAPS